MSENYSPFQNAGDRDTEIKIPEFLRPHSDTARHNKSACEKPDVSPRGNPQEQGRKDLSEKNGTAKTFPVPSPVISAPKPFRLENEDEVNDLLVSLELMFGIYKARVYCLCIAYKNLLKYKTAKKAGILRVAEWYIQKYFSYDPADGEAPVPFCFENREDYELDQKARNMLTYIHRLYENNLA